MGQNEVFAKRLKELCEAKGMNYKTLAEKTGLPIRRVYRMFYGGVSNPGVFLMMRICDVLEITVDEFFGTEDFKEFRV